MVHHNCVVFYMLIVLFFISYASFFAIHMLPFNFVCFLYISLLLFFFISYASFFAIHMLPVSFISICSYIVNTCKCTFEHLPPCLYVALPPSDVLCSVRFNSLILPLWLPMAPFFPLPYLPKTFIDMSPQFYHQKSNSSTENSLPKRPPDG